MDYSFVDDFDDIKFNDWLIGLVLNLKEENRTHLESITVFVGRRQYNAINYTFCRNNGMEISTFTYGNKDTGVSGEAKIIKVDSDSHLSYEISYKAIVSYKKS